PASRRRVAARAAWAATLASGQAGRRVCISLFSRRRRPPRPPLFPYTTLFRSHHPLTQHDAVPDTLARVDVLGRDQIDPRRVRQRSEEHTSELQSPCNLVCRLLLEKKKI